MLTPQEQIEAYTARLKDHPTSLVFLPLAEIHYKQNHLQEAVEACRHGLQHHGSLTKAKLLMGELLFQQGLFTESGEWFRSVLIDHPDHDIAKDFLAKIQRAGNGNGPVVIAPAAPPPEIGMPVEMTARGVDDDIYIPQLKKEPTTTVSIPAKETSVAMPDEAFQTTTMAELYVKQGFIPDAVSLYKKILAQQPNHEQAKRRLAELESPASGETPSREELARRLQTIQTSLQELTAAVKNLERFIQ